MNSTPGLIAILVYAAAVVALFRVLTPRRAALAGFFAGYLFLPRGWIGSPEAGTLTINKDVTAGLALLLGMLACDRRAFRRYRPHGVDVAVLAWLLAPAASLASNGFVRPWLVVDQAWQDLIGWFVPYLAGRVYLADDAGRRDLAIAIVLAGLASIPLAASEAIPGLRTPLGPWPGGTTPTEGIAPGPGGRRPEGFFIHGVEMASFLALTGVVAAWLWLTGGWRPRPAPAWAPAAALAAATIACRGLFETAILGLGLAAVALMRATRPRVVLWSLLAVGPLYVGLRATGAWDGVAMVRVAKATAGERAASSIGFRIRAEDQWLGKVLAARPWLGFGDGNPSYYGWMDGAGLSWPNAWWVQAVRAGGLVGLAAKSAMFFLVPVAATAARRPRRGAGGPDERVAWGLALWVVLDMLDNLHDAPYRTPTLLIDGSLLGGLAAVGRPADPAPPAAAPAGGWSADPSRSDLGHARVRVGGPQLDFVAPGRRAGREEPTPGPDEARRFDLAALVVAAAILAGLEFLGSRPRRAFVPPPQSSTVTAVPGTP